MRSRLQDKRYLPDGEVLFKHYWQMMGDGRSYNKLAKWCASDGCISPQTGNIPHRMAVWLRLWRWALANPRQAFELSNYFIKDDPFMSENYNRFVQEQLIPVTHSCLNDSQYMKWKRINNVK